jgi:RNA polymerase sigma-70 factor (ECF subfamily)
LHPIRAVTHSSGGRPPSSDAAARKPDDDIDPALVAFCDQHHAWLVKLIAGIVADRHVAEDLAQEAFLRVHLHWDRLDRSDAPRAWLTRVAVNLANSWWRRRYAETRANRRHDDGRATSTVTETARAVAVRAAVASLPRRQRSAVALRYFGGMSVAETAAIMRCREGTVKSLTSKGLTVLRHQLGPDPEGPAPDSLAPVGPGPLSATSGDLHVDLD